MKKVSEEKRFGIIFGALCDNIDKQVKDQGLKILKVAADHFQKDADAICWLKIRGILSDREADSARRRLIKLIGKEVYE